MALGINTNLASLSAQRALNTTQSDTNTAMQRLSTGLRINSAKDDAAGMAVASRFTSQISGMQQASRNASDAVSMLQTAEGGLQSMTDNLQRIRELAVQAASDTITDTDRAYLNTEASQLVAEINRVAETTKYNGTALLSGSYETTGLNIQVGADSTTEDSLEVKIADFTTDAIGSTGKDLKASFAAYTHSTAATNGTDDGSVGATPGGTATAGTDGSLTIDVTFGTSGTMQVSITADKTAAEIAALIKAEADTTTGISGTVSGNDVTLTAADGSTVTMKSTLSAGTLGTGGSAGTGGAAGSNGTVATGGAMTVDGAASSLASGTASVASDNTANTTIIAGVDALKVDSRANALTAIDTVDAALKSINEGRAKMGAFQSRFESVVSNLNQGAENAQSGRSRVQDADFAVESANLAKNQVLQQAGMSVLAQANALPQQVLALLQ
ncbi:MAG: flagellin [Gammaproteobacteria bacterium]|nr:flagellin [Gammaproteobacteria bacterium]